MPARATDVKGEMTVASKYIAVRVIDAADNVILDARIDAAGSLEAEKWEKASFGLLDHAPEIKTIEFYVDMSISDIPWDQRLVIWVDNIKFAQQVVRKLRRR